MNHEKNDLINLVSYLVVFSYLLAFEEVGIRVMDEGHTIDVVYLDFAKVFDTIN